MKYQLQYWLINGELIEVEEGIFAFSLIQQSDELEPLSNVAEALGEAYAWSIFHKEGEALTLISNQ